VNTEKADKATLVPERPIISACQPLDLKVSKKQQVRRQQTKILVEDASDSESEDDPWKSMWRNRHPSPDESWMEPVASAA
jgi:hypothetical protein